MVQLPNPGNLRPDPEPRSKAAAPALAPAVPVKLEVQDPLEEEHGPLEKRSRISSPVQQHWGAGTSTSTGSSVAPYNLLDEPSPLGLRLRKSPSLLDLIQTRLSQLDSAATSCITSCDSTEIGKKDLKSTAVSGTSTTDKMKASNFPASLLRIGTWECVSRYEGDLVAKCYFAKHKLVWEVLEGGLKSKIEIQWSDIMALKVTCPENGPGTLDIVLARQPLFFRETDPQPRKHTLWQATSDFTAGQASIHRRHFLQCAQGLLNKHFEKLIQCDPRLNVLSRQPEVILESPYFEPQCSVFEDQNESKCHGFDNLKDACGSTISGFRDLGSPSTAPSVSTASEARNPVCRTPDNMAQETPSPVSGMDTGVVEENAGKGTEESKSSRCWDQFKVPGLWGSMSMSDLVNHIGHCISEQMTPDNPLLSADGSPNKDMLEDLAQYLLSDSQISSASDEQSLMSRVNSLCCLLQKDGATVQSLNVDSADIAAGNDGRDGKPGSLAGAGLERKPLFDLSAAEGESNDDSAYKQPPPSISRKESFGELLMYLPRIASLPQVLFNIVEDAENPGR